MKTILCTVSIFCLLLTACHTAENKMRTESTTSQADNATLSDALNKEDALPQNNHQPTPVSIPQEKKIIKTANLTLEVKNKKNFERQLQTILHKTGAYVVKQENNVYDDKEENTMQIRVPVLQFENLMNELITEDSKQLQKSISSEDVTANFVDTKARLETRKAIRNKYLELLQKATNIDDILKLQQEINNIQEDIESAEARLALLSGDAEFSTIHLTYFEPGQGYSYQSSKPGLVMRMVNAFANGSKLLTSLIVGIVTLWPIWLGVALILFLFKWIRRKSNPLQRKQ